MENNKLPTRQELKTYFETDKYPTQSQFANLIDAYWHKEDNIGTIDHTESTGNVYTKSQSNAKFIISDDFVNDNNKIIAEKIEALGLTTLIEGTETSISGFAANSSKYIFEANDFIAIPVNGGNYSLYMFKGGDKINVQNYLATGISNITMGMVEGLQDALNRKIDKPSGTGNYFIRQNGSINSFVKIEPSSYYLTLFNGNDFVASNAYYNDSKIGIGTQSPSEMLHLDNGRIRSKAIVLDNNAETFPNQLTTNSNKFYGTDSTGIKKEIMMKEDFKNELLSAPSLLTDTEKTAFKTAMNGGWTTNTISVFLINPVILLNTNLEQFVTIYGANLNFNPTNFSVEICSEKSTATNYTIIKTIDNSKVQLNNNGLSLIFYENFGSYPIGKYKIRLSNGQASYVSPVNFEVTDHLNSYDLSNLTWESRAIRNETVLDLQTDSRGVYSKAKFTGLQSSDWQSNNSPVVTVSSSPIANMAEDFLLEFIAYSDSEVYRDMLGGLTNENSPILGNNLFASIRFSNMSTVNNRMYVIKRGNIMTSIYKYNGGISANTEIVSVDSSVPVKLKICLGGTDMYDVRNNLLIKSAYKLN